jgi:cell division protein FtsW
VSAAVATGARRLLRGPRTRRGAPPVEYSILLTATLCLVAFGIVMVFSASSTTSLLGESGDGAYYLKRTLIFGAFGLVALKILSIRGVAIVRPLTGALIAASLVLLLVVHLPGVGAKANGATRWIDLGFLQVQPAEVAKISLILYGAHLLAARPKIVADPRQLVPYLGVVAVTCLLIVVEPDLGTAMVASLSVGALLLAAGVKMRHLAIVAGVIAVLALLMIAIEPYRMERLTGFLDPGADADGAGFQGTQASIAFGSGGLFGVGLGESVQKAFYLPEAHTDMIAAVIGEELGLLGVSLLLGLFVLFGYAGFRTAQRARDRYHKLLAAGLTAMILVQAVVNLFAVMGLAPLTGVPLPFVSYGNSSLLVMLAAVGLLLNIAGGRAAVGRPAERGARLRAVESGRRPRSRGAARPSRRSNAKGRRSSGRDSRARGAGARRRRRAAG